ncbi:hypothetical protein BDQ12DRAFT_665589 [Crucibulum laeve]|uniref:FAD linked oxidase N-terminal domain-containing protein n=1 Tax=Crucibulum laeve TaxID=68775 RepID=A0A5C3M1G5_9AGAR|nr:hypothetical protein BDQ12DRAFT_665589 [Crucibulum laeve]
MVSFNAFVSGRLVHIVPLARFCKTLPGGTRTSQQLLSSVFRDETPGAMYQANWEQAGVKFTQSFNLRLAIKASGHDYLGRSTAKNSLLISTHKLQNISFTYNSVVGGQNFGPAVTLGSATRAQGNFVVDETAAAVVAAGGYVQGGGHSSMPPLLGWVADKCFELDVVLANGTLATANEVQNSDCCAWGWCRKLGSDRLRNVPNIPYIQRLVATVHAKHIFDWDSFWAGQYFYLSRTNINEVSATGFMVMSILTFFPNASVSQAATALTPFLNDIRSIADVDMQQSLVQANINDALFSDDDTPADVANLVMGSRLVPASTYRNSPETVGQVYKRLLDAGATKPADGRMTGKRNMGCKGEREQVHRTMGKEEADLTTEAIIRATAEQTTMTKQRQETTVHRQRVDNWPISGIWYTSWSPTNPANAQTKLNSHTPSFPSSNPDQFHLPLSSSLIVPTEAVAVAGANAGCLPAIAARTASSTSFTDTAAPSFDSTTILTSPLCPEKRMAKMNTDILDCSMIMGTLFHRDSAAGNGRYAVAPTSTGLKAGRLRSGGRLMGARA